VKFTVPTVANGKVYVEPGATALCHQHDPSELDVLRIAAKLIDIVAACVCPNEGVPTYTWEGRSHDISPSRSPQESCHSGIGAIASAGAVLPGARSAVSQVDQEFLPADFFPGFKRTTTKTSGATINFVTAGSGLRSCFSTGIPKRTLNGAT